MEQEGQSRWCLSYSHRLRMPVAASAKCFRNLPPLLLEEQRWGLQVLSWQWFLCYSCSTGSLPVSGGAPRRQGEIRQATGLHAVRIHAAQFVILFVTVHNLVNIELQRTFAC